MPLPAAIALAPCPLLVGLVRPDRGPGGMNPERQVGGSREPAAHDTCSATAGSLIILAMMGAVAYDLRPLMNRTIAMLYSTADRADLVAASEAECTCR